MLMSALVLYLVALMLGLLEIPTLPKPRRRAKPVPVAPPVRHAAPQDRTQSEIQQIRSRFHSRFA